MNDNAITVETVRKRYGTLEALKGVNLEVRRGEFFGLLGPNGAGKSTLINIIAGLTRADSGRVAVLGHDVVRDYRRSRRAVGIVPQELVFDPFFTVFEVLRIQAGYFGLGRESEPWLWQLMEALNLADKARANMRALSGGMKRRVLIAQALVHRPDVVVLDEPTAGVDVELRQSLWAFVRQLHQEGRTIVLTTHYLEEAETLCDRIAILNHGEIIALDTKQGLLARDIGRRMRLCITTASPVADLPATLEVKVRRREPNGLELELDRGSDSIVAVLDSLRDAGVVVTDLHTEEADLEDVFVDLVKQRRSA
jgi:ABC-2 type transport system ATP-binding protein